MGQRLGMVKDSMHLSVVRVACSKLLLSFRYLLDRNKTFSVFAFKPFSV